MPRPTLSFSSPDHIVATIPYLLRHDPGDCLVVVLTNAQGEVLAAARLDWPEDPDLGSWAEAAAFSCANAVSDTETVCVLLVAFTSTCTFPDKIAAAEAVAVALTDHDLTVRDALVVTDGQWRRAPWLAAAGQPVPLRPEVQWEVEKEFGPSPTRTRDEVFGRFAQDEQAATALAGVLSNVHLEPPATPGAIDALGSALVTALVREDGKWSRRDSAMLLRALCFVRVRDVIIYDLLRCTPEQARRGRARLSKVVPAAPAGVRAPVATLTAACYYAAGDGLSMHALLTEAIGDDKNYALARLLSSYYALGFHPHTWLEGVRTLTRSSIVGAEVET